MLLNASATPSSVITKIKLDGWTPDRALLSANCEIRNSSSFTFGVVQGVYETCFVCSCKFSSYQLKNKSVEELFSMAQDDLRHSIETHNTHRPKLIEQYLSYLPQIIELFRLALNAYYNLTSPDVCQNFIDCRSVNASGLFSSIQMKFSQTATTDFTAATDNFDLWHSPRCKVAPISIPAVSCDC